MRKIRGSAFVSLDGVMQAPGGPSEDPTGGFAHGGWLPQFFDEDVGQAIDGFFGSGYDLLLGRRTYDIFAAYWPFVGGEATGIGEIFDRTGKDDGEAEAIAMGEAFTKANKYVLTRGSPASAASIVATSIFRIVIIASNARLAAALSWLVVASSSTRGVICQEKPQRSLHQPHRLSSPPLPTIASQ